MVLDGSISETTDLLGRPHTTASRVFAKRQLCGKKENDQNWLELTEMVIVTQMTALCDLAEQKSISERTAH